MSSWNGPGLVTMTRCALCQEAWSARKLAHHTGLVMLPGAVAASCTYNQGAVGANRSTRSWASVVVQLVAHCDVSRAKASLAPSYKTKPPRRAPGKDKAA